MTARLDRLRDLRAWLDEEIAREVNRTAPIVRPILESVADLYEVTPAEILNTGLRGHQVTRARRGVLWLLRRRGLSYRDLADLLHIDHTSAYAACRKVDQDHAAQALLLAQALEEVPA